MQFSFHEDGIGIGISLENEDDSEFIQWLAKEPQALGDLVLSDLYLEFESYIVDAIYRDNMKKFRLHSSISEAHHDMLEQFILDENTPEKAKESFETYQKFNFGNKQLDRSYLDYMRLLKTYEDVREYEE